MNEWMVMTLTGGREGGRGRGVEESFREAVKKPSGH